MGSRTRIRWTGVAKLAAGAIGCGALALALPALLEPPKPPPLPADVGFTPGAPDHGLVPEGGLHAARIQPDHRHSLKNEPKPRRRAGHGGKDADRRDGKDPKEHRPAKPTRPAPAPVATPPAPAPLPAVTPVPSPPAPVPAAPPTTVQAAVPAPSSEPQPQASDEPGGPSEFGFER
jgi:hypothetical protein